MKTFQFRKSHVAKLGVTLALLVFLVTATFGDIEWTSPFAKKLRYIPRYQTEKEIRGPTFHVHHAVFENPGDEVNGHTVRDTQDRDMPARLKIQSSNIHSVSSDPHQWASGKTRLASSDVHVAESGNTAKKFISRSKLRFGSKQ